MGEIRTQAVTDDQVVYTITGKELMDFVERYSRKMMDEKLKGKVIVGSDERMSRAEVMNLFQVTSVTITEWGKRQLLHPTFIGNRSYYDRAEVMQLYDTTRR